MLFPEKIVDRLISIIPGQIILLCLKRFIICAEKVCYKPCNMYYKLCNMCYKLSNMCYKLCNKKLSCGKGKNSPEKIKIVCVPMKKIRQELRFLPE